jgi:hypothetical protein
MNKLKIGITGTKTFENKNKIKELIFKIKGQTDQPITIVGLGDYIGADRHVKKYALEFGYDYEEMNLPHTPRNLYSAMAESFYDKPFNVKNIHVRNKIYCNYVDSCILFDDSGLKDKKINAINRELKRAKKRCIVIV